MLATLVVCWKDTAYQKGLFRLEFQDLLFAQIGQSGGFSLCGLPALDFGLPQSLERGRPFFFSSFGLPFALVRQAPGFPNRCFLFASEALPGDPRFAGCFFRSHACRFRRRPCRIEAGKFLFGSLSILLCFQGCETVGLCFRFGFPGGFFCELCGGCLSCGCGTSSQVPIHGFAIPFVSEEGPYDDQDSDDGE